jgi:four helix bundle protein
MKTSGSEILLRTKRFSLRIISLFDSLSNNPSGQVIGRQLLRSATSIGAHVREGKHSRSASELFSKVSVALQEAEESRYWIELLGESGIVRQERLDDLLREADSLIAILFASTKTLKRTLR